MRANTFPLLRYRERWTAGDEGVSDNEAGIKTNRYNNVFYFETRFSQKGDLANTIKV